MTVWSTLDPPDFFFFFFFFLCGSFSRYKRSPPLARLGREPVHPPITSSAVAMARIAGLVGEIGQRLPLLSNAIPERLNLRVLLLDGPVHIRQRLDRRPSLLDFDLNRDRLDGQLLGLQRCLVRPLRREES